MKGKIAGWVFLLAALTEVVTNLPKIWEIVKEIVKTIDRTIILEGALIVILIVAGIIYLVEKYKEFRKPKIGLEEARKALLKFIEEEFARRVEEIKKQLPLLLEEKFVGLLQKQIDSHTGQIDGIVKDLDFCTQQFDNIIQWMLAMQDAIKAMGYKDKASQSAAARLQELIDEVLKSSKRSK